MAWSMANADTKKTLKRLKTLRYLLQPRHQAPKTKFVIMSLPCSGSSLLIDLLGSQPTIHCDREILGTRNLFPLAYVQALSLKSQQNAYGFKVTPWQLTTVQKLATPRTFLSHLHNQGWKIIYLKRENTLQAAISEAVAQHKAKLLGRTCRAAFRQTASNEPLQVGKIQLDCDELFKLLAFHERDLQQADEILSNVPYLLLGYEQHLLEESQQQNTVEMVCEFLNLQPTHATTQLVKVEKSIKDTVSNYDELVQRLANTQYITMLGDQKMIRQVATSRPWPKLREAGISVRHSAAFTAEIGELMPNAIRAAISANVQG